MVHNVERTFMYLRLFLSALQFTGSWHRNNKTSQTGSDLNIDVSYISTCKCKFGLKKNLFNRLTLNHKRPPLPPLKLKHKIRVDKRIDGMELSGVICHIGESVNSGHYTSKFCFS